MESMMERLLKLEARRALSGKAFISVVVIGSMLAIASAAFNIAIDYQTSIIGIDHVDTKWMDYSSSSCFKYCMLVDFVQPATYLFFLLAPLFAALPYAWSLGSDIRCGYANQMVSRIPRRTYLFSKGIVVFLSGSLALAIPIALNLIVCACFLPARMPDVYSVISFGIYEDHPFSELFYNAPLLYCLLYFAINFVFGGLWALLISAFSLVVKSRVTVVVAPYLFLLFAKFVSEYLFPGIVHIEITPFGFLRGTGTAFVSNAYYIAFFLVSLFVISILILWRFLRKDML